MGEDSRPARLVLPSSLPNNRFAHAHTPFQRQYHHLYAHRLQALRPVAAQRAGQLWSHVDIVDRVLNATEGHTCVLVGTVFKDGPKKPSVLSSLQDPAALQSAGLLVGGGVLGPAGPGSCTHADDRLVLEDESGRVALAGVLDPAVVNLTTGVVVAVLGTLSPAGVFVVLAHALPGPAPHELDGVAAAASAVDFGGLSLAVPSLSPSPSRSEGLLGGLDAEPFVVLVSDLGFVSEEAARSSKAPTLTHLHLLADLLTAHAAAHDQHLALRGVVRVVVAGDCFPRDAGSPRLSRAPSLARQTTRPDPQRGAWEACDLWCYGLASAGIAVDVMSGPNDVVPCTLPQQPMHPSLFPRASRLANFRCVTNPHKVFVGGCCLLGTSGQPVADALRFVSNVDALDVLCSHLEARHLAPTAPDTLPTFPFEHSDPFLLDRSPDVLFAGNCARFQARTLPLPPAVPGGVGGAGRVAVVCVPSFAATSTAVLVNLRTLECETISVGVAGLAPAGSAAEAACA